ncbi:MAG TPA: hypothetical protein PLR06_06355 [Cyclobacteriaceae bacterium]|nr:hypothetical protein [Cyclobacteriaceae bacterium]
MDSEKIEQLLEKYWSCETTLEEEQQLRDFFHGEVPASLKETASLFQYLSFEKNKSLNENFEKDVTKQLKKRQGGKVISISFVNLARIAAGIVVVVAATFIIRQEIRKSYPQELQDTYTDPQMAFEETKKALMMISGSFGKAKREAGKIKVFNDAEKKIQSKQEAAKANI